MTVRHAFKNDNDKFGFKVNVRYMKGKDFELDPVEDADFISSPYKPLFLNQLL